MIMELEFKKITWIEFFLLDLQPRKMVTALDCTVLQFMHGIWVVHFMLKVMAMAKELNLY